MNPVKVMTRIFCLYTAFLLSGFAAEFTALRIPDGKVIVDGNDEEWIGGNFDQYTIAALSADRLTYIYKDRGEFSGAADLSASVSLANDSKNFYIFAIVKDDILVNSTSDENPYEGDDFEVFIDGHSPDKLFGSAAMANTVENYRQFVFVPAQTNMKWKTGFLWKADSFPGVESFSKPIKGGYVIEIKIPKALFPNLRDNPKQDRVGIDIMINDSDAPGYDGPHNGIKQSLVMGKLAAHFQNPANLTPLLLAKEYLPKTMKVKGTVHPEPDFMFIASRDSSTPIPADLKKSFKAGLLSKPETVYMLMALGLRGEFGKSDIVKYANLTQPPEVRLTAVTIAAEQKDKSLTPVFRELLMDPNLRVRIRALIALSELRDKGAISLIEEISKNDPESYVKSEAVIALKKLQGK